MCLFRFLFLNVRGQRRSQVQDAGVLLDGLIEVGGGDGQPDVQVGQAAAARGEPGVQGLARGSPARVPVARAAWPSRSAISSACRASSGTLPARTPLTGTGTLAPP